MYLEEAEVEEQRLAVVACRAHGAVLFLGIVGLFTSSRVLQCTPVYSSVCSYQTTVTALL